MDNSLMVLEKFPESSFNLLVPVKTLTMLSPLHKISFNTVKLSTSEDDKDVYREKNGELALTKLALSKLMASAGIQVLDSRPIPPSDCVKCRQLSAGGPAQCGNCPSKNDVAWQVTILIPELSGTHRRVKATKELRMADARASMTEKQFAAFFPFRSEHAETKALNRALREGLMIRSTYKEKDLQKPFVVALITPNFEDPDLKAALIQQISGNSDSLYGVEKLRATPLPETSCAGQIESGIQDVEVVDDEPEIGSDTRAEPDEAFFDGAVECHSCGALLAEFQDSKKETWSVEKLRRFSEDRYGKPLCRECCIKAAKEAKGK